MTGHQRSPRSFAIVPNVQSTDDAPFPLPLSEYATPSTGGLLDVLAARMEADPFNAIATAIFLLAVLHTFFAARFTDAAHRLQHRRDANAAAAGLAPTPSVAAELLHFLGEVEVIFGLWGIPLVLAIVVSRGWTTATHYLNDTVNYTEPMFVVVIMALASTRPIVELAEGALRRVANLGGGTPAAWWITILTVGPLLGSFITEPAAMTIAALLLARQFYDLQPEPHAQIRDTRAAVRERLDWRNADAFRGAAGADGRPAMGLGHGLHAEPLRLARRAGHRGINARVLRGVPTGAARLWPRAPRYPTSFPRPRRRADLGSASLPIPWWVTGVYVLFIVWTVANAHYPALFLAGFLFFLGFDRATSAYSTLSDFRTPLLVGFFLGGLVIHGGLQGWWIGPILSSLTELPLFAGSTLLTAFNDNALITYLATLVPNLDDRSEIGRCRRGGDRGRPHRHRQRAEPRRPGATRPLLRWGDLAAWTAGGSAGADRDLCAGFWFAVTLP